MPKEMEITPVTRPVPVSMMTVILPRMPMSGHNDGKPPRPPPKVILGMLVITLSEAAPLLVLPSSSRLSAGPTASRGEETRTTIRTVFVTVARSVETVVTAGSLSSGQNRDEGEEKSVSCSVRVMVVPAGK